MTRALSPSQLSRMTRICFPFDDRSPANVVIGEIKDIMAPNGQLDKTSLPYGKVSCTRYIGSRLTFLPVEVTTSAVYRAKLIKRGGDLILSICLTTGAAMGHESGKRHRYGYYRRSRGSRVKSSLFRAKRRGKKRQMKRDAYNLPILCFLASTHPGHPPPGVFHCVPPAYFPPTLIQLDAREKAQRRREAHTRD
ncbi:hypothetical protein DBV15_09372 [Temnothorax longispinosus]|uniref:Uncharacterized protein n=1 Tax=Temnothorax longispinosus TaxID=300112 RepID=A0A4S2KKI9_9HYME|nr:hypothetical protein DBV15_09372 [Temnothorax longispinosus]